MTPIVLRRAVAGWRSLRLGARAYRHGLADPPRIRRLIVMLRSGCALRCRMCDLWLERPTELPRVAVLELLRSPALAAGAGIHWTGGEPFLYPDFPRLYAEARALRPGSSMSISTSGAPAEAVREFMSGGPDLRNTTLVFSYDGAGTHDDQRGRPGAETELLDLLAEVRRATARVAVRMTITPENAHAVRATFRKTREFGVPVQFGVADSLEQYTNGVRERGPGAFALSKEAQRTLEGDLRAIFRELSLRREREEIGHLWSLLRRLRRGDPAAAEPRTRWTAPCPVPSQSAQVRSDGALLTCRSSPPVGNVLREGLAAAWMSEAAVALRRTGCARCEPRYAEF